MAMASRDRAVQRELYNNAANLRLQTHSLTPESEQQKMISYLSRGVEGIFGVFYFPNLKHSSITGIMQDGKKMGRECHEK